MLFWLLLLVGSTSACHPQFEKELRYLDLYLGIQPADDGELPQQDAAQFASYVPIASSLDCSLEMPCLWKNAPSDGLLDTSEFWLFQKSDDKIFPYQIQPGPPEIAKGTRLLVAGNTSSTSESAVLLSAPVACQRGIGTLSFSYWLYNHAKVEVVIVRATNRRKHLQALSRPVMNCHFLRPANDLCQVSIPAVNEPFRIAIRAFNLKDNVVGSMMLLNNITYRAQTCGESPFPSIFSSVTLDTPPSTDISSLSQLDCSHPRKGCRWGNTESAVSEWRVGRSAERWSTVMETSASDAQPNSSFLFLVVDALSPRPYATLRSQLIPCTQKTTTLSFRYWLKAGTQVEVCSVDEEGVPLSCAYLAEEDSPGPIEIDVDPYDKPFRFTLEMIAFDETSLGLIAISDMTVRGLLCSEQLPPISTTIDPPTIASMFGVQRGPGSHVPYSLSLDCDFSKDYCSQWVNDDGKVSYGVAPKDSERMPIPKEIKGNVAVFILSNQTSSSLRSREVPCAHHAVLSVTYMRSEHASFRLCALDNCVDALQSHGVISIEASSTTPFEFTMVTSSTSDAVVVVRSVFVVGDVCPLRSVEQMVCHKLQCSFADGLCSYTTPIEKEGDLPLTWNHTGLSTTLTVSGPRSVLRSPSFDLPAASLLVLSLTQNTFGSRVLICPDVTSGSDSCHELLGPRVSVPGPRRVTFPLDAGARRFALVLSHDHAEQFGPAPFEIHAIDIRTEDDTQLCF